MSSPVWVTRTSGAIAFTTARSRRSLMLSTRGARPRMSISRTVASLGKCSRSAAIAATGISTRSRTGAAVAPAAIAPCTITSTVSP